MGPRAQSRPLLRLALPDPIPCPPPATALPSSELVTMFPRWGAMAWDGQFKALDVIRRLAVFHPQLVPAIVEGAVDAALQAAGDLRSCLARNGLLLFKDLYHCIRATTREPKPTVEPAATAAASLLVSPTGKLVSREEVKPV